MDEVEVKGSATEQAREEARRAKTPSIYLCLTVFNFQNNYCISLAPNYTCATFLTSHLFSVTKRIRPAETARRASASALATTRSSSNNPDLRRYSQLQVLRQPLLRRPHQHLRRPAHTRSHKATSLQTPATRLRWGAPLGLFLTEDRLTASGLRSTLHLRTLKRAPCRYHLGRTTAHSTYDREHWGGTRTTLRRQQMV